MTKIFLFSGGRSYKDYRTPKPLIEYGGGPLVSAHYKHISNYFDEIVYLVESASEESFRKVFETHSMSKASILVVDDDSTTLDKVFSVAHASSSDSILTFSYPDIFAAESFWRTENGSGFTISSVPIKSRFPRIIGQPFSTQVRGVSDYDTNVPANPHFIFGGKFSAHRSLIRELLHSFYVSSSKDGNHSLELDFFDYVAGSGRLYSEVFHDEWCYVDSYRDYNFMMSKYFAS